MRRPPAGEAAPRILPPMRYPLLILALTALATQAWGQSAPQRIPPPDSDAYCQALRARIAQAPATGDNIAQLTAEGEALCAAGQSRRGIAKLRRALRMALTEG